MPYGVTSLEEATGECARHRDEGAINPAHGCRSYEPHYMCEFFVDRLRGHVIIGTQRRAETRMRRDREPEATTDRDRARTARGAAAPLIAAVTLVGAAALLFSRLGGYALWEDEAVTALHALGVWRTGDTTAVIGHNVVGYRAGSTLVGLRERYTS